MSSYLKPFWSIIQKRYKKVSENNNKILTSWCSRGLWRKRSYEFIEQLEDWFNKLWEDQAEVEELNKSDDILVEVTSPKQFKVCHEAVNDQDINSVIDESAVQESYLLMVFKFLMCQQHDFIMA